MRLKKILFSALCAAWMLFSCACGSPAPYQLSTFSMGAQVSQTVYGDGADTAAKDAASAVSALDNRISWRREGSELFLLNAGKSTAGSEELRRLVSLSLELQERTDGAFDITILPVVRLWGFDGDETMQKPDDNALRQALALVGSNGITLTAEEIRLSDGVLLDLSALGKGAGCDAAVAVYREAGVTGVVAVGGSVGIAGSKNGGDFTVGVRDPFAENALLGTLSLQDCFVSTSGSYEKQFTFEGVRYHHLLDARTGYPAENGLVSVTVVCGNGALSDALSSAAFVVGEEKGLALLASYDAEGLFVRSDGSVTVTEGLWDAFETGAATRRAEREKP